MINEKKIVINGVEICYAQKSGRQDTKHLVIVFSGFSGDGKPTYNYANALINCPADVLWIKDYFYGGESYYICADGQLSIEDSVYKLITIILNKLNLTHRDCTLLGGSKGGSAALYYGMKYDFENIIATVPQFHIGSYVEVDWGYAFKHMVGNTSKEEVEKLQDKLDSLILNEIAAADAKKNVYIITSHADPQFETEIKKNIHRFDKFTNFNILYADSLLIDRHNQVNRHIVSITMSIVSLTAMGIAPVFSNSNIKYRDKSSEGEGYLTPFITVKSFAVDHGLFYPEGISIINGIPCPEYTDIDMVLVLKNEKECFEIKLAKGHKPNLNHFINPQANISYDKGWFCSKNHDGFMIDDLPLGMWDVKIRINARGIIREGMVIADAVLEAFGEGNDKKMWFSATNQGSKMIVIHS